MQSNSSELDETPSMNNKWFLSDHWPAIIDTRESKIIDWSGDPIRVDNCENVARMISAKVRCGLSKALVDTIEESSLKRVGMEGESLEAFTKVASCCSVTEVKSPPIIGINPWMTSCLLKKAGRSNPPIAARCAVMGETPLTLRDK